MAKETWVPCTEEEWRQLDESRMGSRIPFWKVIIGCFALAAALKLLVFPYWDSQVTDLYKQQQALEAACVKAGGIVMEDGCRGLRKAGK